MHKIVKIQLLSQFMERKLSCEHFFGQDFVLLSCTLNNYYKQNNMQRTNYCYSPSSLFWNCVIVIFTFFLFKIFIKDKKRRQSSSQSQSCLKPGSRLCHPRTSNLLRKEAQYCNCSSQSSSRCQVLAFCPQVDDPAGKVFVREGHLRRGHWGEHKPGHHAEGRDSGDEWALVRNDLVREMERVIEGSVVVSHRACSWHDQCDGGVEKKQDQMFHPCTQGPGARHPWSSLWLPPPSAVGLSTHVGPSLPTHSCRPLHW